jgi:hypothetical protein
MSGQLDASIQERKIPHFIISEVELEDLEAGAGTGDRQVAGLSAGVAIAFFVVFKTVKNLTPNTHAVFVAGFWFAIALFGYSTTRTLVCLKRNHAIARRVRQRKTVE